MHFLTKKAVKIESPNYGVLRFKMNFKNIRLLIAYSGVSRREIFQNSNLIGMNREDSNLVSSKKRRVRHLEKMDRTWLLIKIIKIFTVLQRKHACFFPKNPLNFIKKLSLKPVVLRRANCCSYECKYW